MNIETYLYIAFLLFCLLFGAWLIYIHVFRESPVAKANRILEYADEAFRNKNLVSLKAQIHILGDPVCPEQETTLNIIRILVEALERSGEAKVIPKK